MILYNYHRAHVSNNEGCGHCAHPSGTACQRYKMDTTWQNSPRTNNGSIFSHRPFGIELPQISGKIYIVILPQVVSNLKELQERDFDEKRRMLALWLYILHSVDQNVVSQWLERETQSRLIMYLDTLTLAVDTFEVRRKLTLQTASNT